MFPPSINLSLLSRKELYKMVQQSFQGKEKQEVGVKEQEVDVSPLVALPEPISVPHPDWPRQTESGTGGEAAIREQLNHHSLPASQQIVTARVTPGPVVSCCPPHSLGFR